MHFGAAQRFAASIAGVKQTSLKLRAEASAGLPRSIRGMQACGAGLPRSVRGYAALWRGMFSERGVVSYHVPSAARSFAFGELARIEGHVGLWRGMLSERGGWFRAMYRAPRVHSLSGSWRASRGMQACGEGCSRNVGWFRTMYRAPRVHSLSGSWRISRRLCFASARTVGSKRFGIGELAHIEALAFCVRAPRVPNIRAVARDCLAGSRGRDYKFRVFDP